jgi:hypothetical protein
MTEDGSRGASSQRSETGGPGRLRSDPEGAAEEWAERVARWALRATARAREEAEDIWAEAQALRRDR